MPIQSTELYTVTAWFALESTTLILGFPEGSMVKKKKIHLLMQETQETWVQSLGWEDPLEEEMTTHSSILAWNIPWTKEPGGLQSMGSQRVRHDYAGTHTIPPF